jgi:hypothetical protein
MVCNTEGTPERIVINVSELEQQEEVVWTSSKNDAAQERRIGRDEFSSGKSPGQMWGGKLVTWLHVHMGGWDG